MKFHICPRNGSLFIWHLSGRSEEARERHFRLVTWCPLWIRRDYGITTWEIPSGYRLLKTAIEIIDFPMKNGDFPVRYVM
jgi:hypothetical protein